MTSVVVANIPHTLNYEDALHDTRLALRRGRVTLLCEIDKSNDHALDHAATEYRRRAHFQRRRTQVTTPRLWRVEPLYRTLTDGLRGINPPRGIASVYVPAENTRYVSMHPPNGKHNPLRRMRAWRELQWNRYERKAARMVTRWVDRNGERVVAGGDTNDRTGIRLHPDQIEVVGHGLMRLYAIPTPGDVVLVDRPRVIRANRGDHPFLRALITFTQEKP